MNKPVILVTRAVPEAALKKLAEVFEVHLIGREKAPSRAELQRSIADADALLCLLTDSIDRELISAAPKLRCISNYAVGFNNIDLPCATERGITVCNTPGVLTETTADLAWALIMSCARRIVESDRLVRAGKFTGWEPLLCLGYDVYGKTLGIIGMGRIGKAVARRSAGFNMRVLYHDPEADPAALPAEYVAASVDQICSEADFISLHAPLTASNRHLIGPAQLSLMKASAVLINTARGQLVDEDALIRFLRDGRIAAAGLDVYEHEPEIPSELLALPNVVLLPHIGSASIETRTRMAMLAAENAIAVIEGRKPPARVN